MLIESVKVSGFRSFGQTPCQAVLAPGITAVVGPNGAGKTAFLQALAKVFGVSRAQRTILRSDFHVAPGEDPESRDRKDLFVDVLVALPELLGGAATPETVAPIFRHMLLERPGKAPVFRLRLEATWEDDLTSEGEVSQDLFWVDTLEEEPSTEKKRSVAPADRGLIQLYYTPASRDAAAQVRASTGALAARLLRAIDWAAGTREGIEETGEKLDDLFAGEPAIVAITKAVQARWSALHDGKVDTDPRLSLVSRRFEEVVSRIAVVFEQGPDGRDRTLGALSDGQQSLFYFALAAAVFDMERQVVAGLVPGFVDDALTIPALTIFAMEEPENHLSPFFLARIVNQVRSLIEYGGAQAIITSHSPAVLSRVKPVEVRYCRCDPTARASSLKGVLLPPGRDEAAKFVRGAMQAYPELYFARFVVLVEGDSEQVVLPRLAEALDLMIDPAFVAIVPLGGRHVQHFWRLLADLGIPHATLLDLDLGRSGGGFGRIKTAIQNLIEIGASKDALLRLSDGTVLSDERLEAMHTWQGDHLSGWVTILERYGVFFSSPLDLDLAMLHAFPAAYAATVPKGGGPRMAEDKAAEVVLGTDGPGTVLYQGDLSDYLPILPAYRYHFLTRSKPATHLAALTHLEPAAMKKGMPPLLAQVLKHVADNLRQD